MNAFGIDHEVSKADAQTKRRKSYGAEQAGGAVAGVGGGLAAVGQSRRAVGHTVAAEMSARRGAGGLSDFHRHADKAKLANKRGKIALGVGAAGLGTQLTSFATRNKGAREVHKSAFGLEHETEIAKFRGLGTAMGQSKKLGFGAASGMARGAGGLATRGAANMGAAGRGRRALGGMQVRGAQGMLKASQTALKNPGKTGAALVGGGVAAGGGTAYGMGRQSNKPQRNPRGQFGKSAFGVEDVSKSAGAHAAKAGKLKNMKNPVTAIVEGAGGKMETVRVPGANGAPIAIKDHRQGGFLLKPKWTETSYQPNRTGGTKKVNTKRGGGLTREAKLLGTAAAGGGGYVAATSGKRNTKKA